MITKLTTHGTKIAGKWVKDLTARKRVQEEAKVRGLEFDKSEWYFNRVTGVDTLPIGHHRLKKAK